MWQEQIFRFQIFQYEITAGDDRETLWYLKNTEKDTWHLKNKKYIIN